MIDPVPQFMQYRVGDVVRVTTQTSRLCGDVGVVKRIFRMRSATDLERVKLAVLFGDPLRAYRVALEVDEIEHFNRLHQRESLRADRLMRGP